jgi:alpha-ketoglutarate-dependent taurine dioxygenase
MISQTLALPAAPDLPVDHPHFVRAAGHARRLLPAEIHDALVDFSDASSSSGVLLVRRLPIGNLPATPATPTTVTDKSNDTEFLLLALARCLGQPVGYRPELNGSIVQNIVPVKSTQDRQISTSSKVVLQYHTETAFHPHRPRYLLLLCLRGDAEARTTYVSIYDVVKQLASDTVALLRQPRFRTAVDESFLNGASPRLLGPMPIISGSADSLTFVYDADLMVGVDSEAQMALEELTRVVRENEQHVVLDTGDLLVIDNNVAVHGRSPFTPRFDGTDRWLQRTFVVCDLAPSAAERNGRIITTLFAS